VPYGIAPDVITLGKPMGNAIHRVAVGLLVAATLRAIALFLVTLITLADVGSSDIQRVQVRPPR
jgi:hypothetical protein